MKTLNKHIAAESRRFHEVLTDADPVSRVPSCPDWSVDDLLWHLAEVQLFWAEVVDRRLQEPEPAEAAKPERPTGQRSPMDATLATDGVDEALRVMFGGIPGWAAFTADPGVIRLQTTDTGSPWDVMTGRFRGTSPNSGTTYDEPALEVVESQGDVAVESEPVVVAAAPAAELDLWLWGRVAEDVLVVDGDRSALERLKAVVSEGIE